MREPPGDAVHRGRVHSGRTGADRVMEGMDSSVAAAEELAADGAVDVQCSRVAVVGGDAAVGDPAVRDGDDGGPERQPRRAPPCILRSVDGPSRRDQACPGFGTCSRYRNVAAVQ